MPAYVNSISGPLSGEDLGDTLTHEHTVFGFAGAEFDYRLESRTEEESISFLAPYLREAHDHGVRTIVDAAPADLGRNVRVDIELAKRTGLNIIMATGLYSALPLPHYANPHRPIDAEGLASNFAREINEGIGETGIRAGVIKVATTLAVMTPYAETALRAAGMAQAATGVAIITHTEEGTLGPEQLDAFECEGADLSRVVIGHNDTADLRYLLSILERGAVLGFDRMGYEELIPDRVRVATIVALVQLGFASQIVLSHDCNLGRLLPRGYELAPRAVPASYSHIHRVIVPMLIASGVEEPAVRQMLVGTPARVLAGHGAG